jgi:hypothetical protein
VVGASTGGDAGGKTALSRAISGLLGTTPLIATTIIKMSGCR